MNGFKNHKNPKLKIGVIYKMLYNPYDKNIENDYFIYIPKEIGLYPKGIIYYLYPTLNRMDIGDYTVYYDPVDELKFAKYEKVKLNEVKK